MARGRQQLIGHTRIGRRAIGAYLWGAKTATVSLHGNLYQVDALLAGRRVELVFDPFDLTKIEVRVAGVPAGTAIPHHIGRHARPKGRPKTPPAPPPPTGIDYAHLLDTAHHTELAQGVNYAALTSPTGNGEQPGRSLNQPELPLDPDGQLRS